FTGPVFHTIGFGTELGRQAGIDVRNTGLFPNGTNTEADNPFAPTYFGPINFVHQYPGFFAPGVTTADSNSQYQLDLQSAYARDTIEITRWLQLIAAVRVDRFDETALDLNTRTRRTRVDKLVSPADAVIFKPVDNLSIYYSYMVSSSCLRRPVQRVHRRQRHPRAAEVRATGNRGEMEPPAAAHIYCRGLRFASHQRSAARPEQPGIFHLVRQQPDSRLRNRAQGLHQRPLAVLAPLRLHRCAGVERPLAHHPRRQPHSARSVPSVLVVEQVSDRSGLVGLARRHLLLGFVRVVRRQRLPAGLPALRRRRLCA